MGEMAEGLIDGTFDFETGEYLGDGPGYPRTWKDVRRPKQGYPRHRSRKVNGIKNYLQQYMPNKEMFPFCTTFVKEECGIPIKKESWAEVAKIIQKRFGQFKLYVDQKFNK